MGEMITDSCTWDLKEHGGFAFNKFIILVFLRSIIL